MRIKMVNKTNIIKILRLLVLIPAIVLLFACGENDKTSTAIDPTADENVIAEKHRECWQASVLGAIYETAGRLAMGMYGEITQGALTLMMVAFALWLSFRLMLHVSSFTEESPAEVWTEIAKKFFVCFICGFLASSVSGSLFVLNSIIFPIYNAFLELGSEIMKVTNSDSVTNGAWDATVSVPILGTMDVEMSPAEYTAVCSATGNMDVATLEGFPKAPQQMMECMVCAVNERLNFGYKMGWRIMLAPGFMAMFCGLIVMAVFTFVKLGFVFYLVDSVFRFAMMVLILPILIMSFAFKATKKWATTGFFTILNSGAFMMGIAIVMFITIATIQQILIDNQAIFAGEEKDFADFSVPFLMLLLLCFLVVASIGVAKTIIDSLVGGGGAANTQKRLAALAATIATAVFIWATGGLGKIATANSSKLRALSSNMKKVKSGISSLAKDDDDDEDKS